MPAPRIAIALTLSRGDSNASTTPAALRRMQQQLAYSRSLLLVVSAAMPCHATLLSFALGLACAVQELIPAAERTSCSLAPSCNDLMVLTISLPLVLIVSICLPVPVSVDRPRRCVTRLLPIFSLITLS